MGTRALVHFQEDGETLCTVYHQYDGYLSGVGADIASLLVGRKIVNGYTNKETQANGAGCLAALYIAENKDGAGNLYIARPNAKDCWEEYTYWVDVIDSTDVRVNVKIGDRAKLRFSKEQFIDYIKENEDD